MTCGWHGIVRHGPVAERENEPVRRTKAAGGGGGGGVRRGIVAAALGIGFNAHCYQRREDATQFHCLAGLVTAGDIINRLRASRCVRVPPSNHSPSLREWKEPRRRRDTEAGGGGLGSEAAGGRGGKYRVSRIGKYHRVSAGCARFGYRRPSEPAENRILEMRRRRVRFPPLLTPFRAYLSEE